jgi:hypothetical protein
VDGGDGGAEARAIAQAVEGRIAQRTHDLRIAIAHRLALSILATLSGMKAKKRRRPGATATIGVSLDPATKRTLKTLANARHGGNVSALIAEMAMAAARQVAFERAWQWYGGPEPSEETNASIDAELEEGWAHARKSAATKKRRRRAA